MIAGYAFNTEQYCGWCIEPIVKQLLVDNGDATIWGDTDAETMLDRLALLLGENREAWDSNDYPVPFSLQQAEHDAGWAQHDGQPIPRCANNKCRSDFLGEL